MYLSSNRPPPSLPSTRLPGTLRDILTRGLTTRSARQPCLTLQWLLIDYLQRKYQLDERFSFRIALSSRRPMRLTPRFSDYYRMVDPTFS